MNKLVTAFRKLPLPWRVEALDKLVRENDAPGLDAFLQKFPEAVTWEKLRMPRDGRDGAMRRHSYLQEAIFQEKPEALEMLLKHGASTSTPDKEGYTALQAAMMVGWPCATYINPYCMRMVESLVAHGADITQKDKRGDTALDLALQNQNIDAVAFLLAHGAKLEDVTSSLGGGAIQVCLLDRVHGPKDHEKMLGWLLKNTAADIEKQDRDGRTPLFYAHTEPLARLMVAAGADAAHIDQLGMTAAMMGWGPRSGNRTEYLNSETVVRERYEAAKRFNACHRQVAAKGMKPLKIAKREAPTIS